MKQLLFAVFMGMAFSVNGQDSSKVKPKVKPIDRFKIWKDGKLFDVDDLKVICVYDDFESEAKLYYELQDSTGVMVTNGNVSITGADYDVYSSKPNHPDRAVLLTMKYLNIQSRVAREAKRAAVITATSTSN
jgi:ribosomal protein S26